MKARMILLAACLAALTLAPSCRKVSPAWRPTPGDQIRFRAMSNYTPVGTGTRTVYSGEYFVVDDSKYERIDWVQDDCITIAYVSMGGNDGLRVSSETYKVTGVNNNGTRSSFATLAPAGTASGANGLEWTDNEAHSFYACYPAMDKDGEYDFSTDGETITAVVPFDYSTDQSFTRESNVFLPLESPVLLCGTSDPVAAGGEINLVFYPHSTAFEFEVAAEEGDSFPLRSFTLSSASKNITGRFLWTMDPSTFQWDDVEKVDAVSKTVSADFTSYDITLTDSQAITFTVLIREVDLDDVTISFQIEKDGDLVNRSLRLAYADNNFVYFSGGYKHRIHGLRIPLELTPAENGWFDASSAGGYVNQEW